MERFTRFIEWPGLGESEVFKIAVIGESPFNSSLDELFNGTIIKNKKVELIYTSNIQDVTKVNLVFISNSEKRRMKEILSALSKSPILIISDSKGFCEMGVHINMFVVDKYVRYEINQNTIEASGLKVSSLLFSSAKIINTDD